MKYVNGVPVLEDSDPAYEIKLYSERMASALYFSGGLIGVGDGQMQTQYPADSTGEFSQLKIERIAPRHCLLTGTIRAYSAIPAGNIIKLRTDLPPELTPAQTHLEFVPMLEGTSAVKIVRFGIFRTRLLQIYCPMALAQGTYGGVSIIYRLDK